MTRIARAALAILILTCASAGAGEVNVDGKVFRVPEGFTVERVAGPPLVDRPIVADFDEQGRLYVADSSGSNDPPAQQLENPSHRIVRLEDTNGDGTFDKSIVYADKMMFPEGAMWRDGSLYVAAPPSIWKLTDTDGDGKADRREEWFQGKTLTGCANDLHGPYNGPDGWIYWCKGAFAEQTYETPGKPPLVTRAAHIFRARPDGTGVEPVMTGGMDNPVEVAFSSSGERFFTTTFLQHPGGGKRDGIIHAIYGGVYGKDHDVIDGHTRTGPDLMPVMTHLGPAAPSGLMRYESSVFGKDYQDNLFASLFNMHKVTRHILEPDGATFKTTDSDFLAAAENLDFHPTDVLEDADGSVLVLDTGGWYKLCCPTSQIGKPDILGAIYRVRRVDASRVEDPRGLTLDWKAMSQRDRAEHLDDPRPVVRKKAIESLRSEGSLAVPILQETIRNGPTPEARRNAVWATSRLVAEGERNVVLGAFADPDESVRLAAVHVVSVWRDGNKIAPMLELLRISKSPRLVRASAEALGRLKSERFGHDLLAALDRFPEDRIVEHSIIYALIESGAKASCSDALESASALQRRAAMIALDQMGESILAGVIRKALAAGEREAEAAAWICEQNPSYGKIVAEVLRERLRNPGDDPERSLSAIGSDLARFSRFEPVQALIGELLVKPDVRAAALKAIERSKVKPIPTSWQTGLLAAMSSNDETIIAQAVKSARSVLGEKNPNDDALTAALRTLGTSETAPATVRLDALSALPKGTLTIDRGLLRFLSAQLTPDQPVSSRLAAADILAGSRLDPAGMTAVARLLEDAGPLEADRLLPLFDGCEDDEVGRSLATSLKNSALLGSLRVETLKPRFAKFSEDIQNQAQSLYDMIERGQAEQSQKLDGVLSSMPEGDMRRGQAVFQSTRAACVSCHAIGYIGGNVGPDLSRIGSIRGDRDIIEAVIYPSASFVRSYEPVIVATKDGQVHSGILKKDAPDEVVLAVAADKEVRIARDDVEEMKAGTVSVMPAGLDTQLTKQEIADLLAFLKSRK